MELETNYLTMEVGSDSGFSTSVDEDLRGCLMNLHHGTLAPKVVAEVDGVRR